MLKPFVFIDIWFKKQNTYRKWLKTNLCSFVWRVWKWKEKRTNIFWPSGILFTKIWALNLNYWRWWDPIQARKLKFLNFTMFFLHIDRKSKNQSLEEATKIVKKYCELKKEEYHGDKFLSICPTNLHWMAILNDSKAIEVNIKSYYYFASTVNF